MVRMGEKLPDQARAFISTAVDASEEVADQLASAFRVEVDSSDVSEVAAMLAKEMRREAFNKANGAKFERELVEKYGVLKDVILHPTVQVRASAPLGLRAWWYACSYSRHIYYLCRPRGVFRAPSYLYVGCCRVSCEMQR